MNPNVVLNLKTQIPVSIKSSEVPTNQSKIQHLKQLKECTSVKQYKQIHTQIIKSYPSYQTELLLSKLVEALVNSNHTEYANRVFDGICEKTTFLCNTMVRGYTLNGACNESLQIYIQMQCHELKPDNFTYPFLIKACTCLNQGKVIHSLVIKNPSLKTDDIYFQTSLIGFYSNYGDLDYARKLFDRMCQRNVVSWTAMIMGYVKQKKYSEGLALFHRMQIEGIEINEFTLVNVLSACAHLGAFEMGKWVHGYIHKNAVFLNPTLATALIDMYMKCGYVDEASQVFDKLTERSISTWNSIIGGLAMHGYGEAALERFNKMLRTGTKPDHITFIGVLSACTHSGMVEKGREHFYSMTRDFEIEPHIKHYGCLVDLLGRAGHLEEAYEIMKNMPIKRNGVLWGTLLNACSAHGNVELAEIAMERLIELEPFNDGNYVIMSNMYASKGQWEKVIKMRRFMKDRGILKTPGCSWIEVNNVIHEFVVGDGRHPRSEEIYSMLDDVAEKLKEVGYVP
ncbi:hypothetical protein MKW92_030993 [Papaver armeniacum]|nr:hypothetical protein MKW92_030993 [Papaver armeniacum]